MLHKQYVEGIKFLRAWYSETRNDTCLRQKLSGRISFHVNEKTQIVAANDYTAGNHDFPTYADSVLQGELHLTKARIGNYDTNTNGLIGWIDAADWLRLKQEESMDSMEELLMQFNVLDGENDVKGEVTRFKEYMRPFGLVTPEDPEQKTSTTSAEELYRATGNGSVPVSVYGLKTAQQLRFEKLMASLNKPT